jgi:hypothetical protein
LFTRNKTWQVENSRVVRLMGGEMSGAPLLWLAILRRMRYSVPAHSRLTTRIYPSRCLLIQCNPISIRPIHMSLSQRLTSVTGKVYSQLGWFRIHLLAYTFIPLLYDIAGCCSITDSDMVTAFPGFSSQPIQALRRANMSHRT